MCLGAGAIALRANRIVFAAPLWAVAFARRGRGGDGACISSFFSLCFLFCFAPIQRARPAECVLVDAHGTLGRGRGSENR